jgi:two-component system CheB/CheR fusion protein
VAIARDGLYPQSIEADVSPDRLAAFFTREDHSYRVSPELRANVVFTVQDLLADPPFARLDFVSCRNLLIYLRPEAQAKVAAVFHFALREGGLLLLGNAEAISAADGRFAVVSKPERLYRRVGGSRFGDLGLSPSAGEGARMRMIAGPTQAPSRQADLAELCRRMVLETYGPAAVLINRKLECLHFQGPIDRYLKVAPGRPAHDLIAMAREGVRVKLSRPFSARCGTMRASLCPAAGPRAKPAPSSFQIVVEPAPSEREDLLLVCFVETPAPEIVAGGSVPPADVPSRR